MKFFTLAKSSVIGINISYFPTLKKVVIEMSNKTQWSISHKHFFLFRIHPLNNFFKIPKRQYTECLSYRWRHLSLRSALPFVPYALWWPSSELHFAPYGNIKLWNQEGSCSSVANKNGLCFTQPLIGHDIDLLSDDYHSWFYIVPNTSSRLLESFMKTWFERVVSLAQVLAFHTHVSSQCCDVTMTSHKPTKA